MTTMNSMLDLYFTLQKEVHEAFGYQEDWKVIPLQDYRDVFWMLDETESGGKVVYSDVPFTEEVIRGGEIYSGIIYTQRFLPKWVYRTEEFTMISMDIQTDGNKFLAIFENTKETKDSQLMKLYYECWKL